MKTIEKILVMVEKGDPVAILAEDSLVETFNELLRHGLIDILDDKVILTSEGEKARMEGLDKVIADLRIREELKEFSPTVQKREWKLVRFFSALILSLILFLLTWSIVR